MRLWCSCLRWLFSSRPSYCALNENSSFNSAAITPSPLGRNATDFDNVPTPSESSIASPHSFRSPDLNTPRSSAASSGHFKLSFDTSFPAHPPHGTIEASLSESSLGTVTSIFGAVNPRCSNNLATPPSLISTTASFECLEGGASKGSGGELTNVCTPRGCGSDSMSEKNPTRIDDFSFLIRTDDCNRDPRRLTSTNSSLSSFPSASEDATAASSLNATQVSLSTSSRHSNDLAETVVLALQGDASAWKRLEKGKVTASSVTLIFDRFEPDELRRICHAIRNSTYNISSVEFGCNNFGDRGLMVVSECLRKHHRLKHLSIWGNCVGDEGANSLGDLLGSCALTSVVLSNNEITDSGLATLCMTLPACRHTLQSLDLSVNAMICDRGVASLVKALKSDEGLKIQHLNLNNDSIANEGARHLASWLRSPSCPLASLDLSYNIIDDTGAHALAEALELNGTLVELNLSGNLLTRVGMKVLLKTLENERTGINRSILMEDMTPDRI